MILCRIEKLYGSKKGYPITGKNKKNMVEGCKTNLKVNNKENNNNNNNNTKEDNLK